MIITIPKRFVRFLFSPQVWTPSGVSKFDVSDNLVSKNSAQIQNFTS